ncbi:hypothetical protein [Undibacterium curvum]|uniref:Uncharacterized protein n=1 Tax=Undibacterium curvum TaxID=2762294 RepID=A0ABR7A528_9BURK|nr:hypothetical protein [Undibacterium curvum]MBC3932010.1 hypothetical protein [Undibacterium curvum]
MNNIETLRSHLFNTLTALNDKDKPMDIDRAKAISEVAQTIINSAKVEVEYAKATGAAGSNFLEMAPIRTPPGSLPPGITGITKHRLRG